MNKEQLNAIKERVVNTTPGAWRIDKKSDSRAYITDVWMDGEDNGLIEVHRFGESSKYDDARFIAHARQDVPALIETVEKLMNVRDVSYAEYAELDAENKRLRNRLRESDETNGRLKLDLFDKNDVHSKEVQSLYNKMHEYQQLAERHAAATSNCQDAVKTLYQDKHALLLQNSTLKAKLRDVTKQKRYIMKQFNGKAEQVRIFQQKNKKLQKKCGALEFHLAVSDLGLDSEGMKADAFQRVLEKVYDELGGMYEKNQALTRHRMLEIVCDIESVLDGEPSLRDDDDE